MEYISFFTQVMTIALGGCLALFIAFYFIWPIIENKLVRINAANQRRDLTKDIAQLRFAAYERLLLFVNRISPAQVMLRNHTSDGSINEFKQNVIADIEAEYQHNYTQQLYVSDFAWVIISDLKNSTASLFQNAVKILPDHANIDDYIEIVLKHTAEMPVNPYVDAQIILKKELLA